MAVEREVDLVFQEDCSQEFEPFIEGGLAGLLAVQLQIETLQQIVRELQRLGGVLGRLAEHEEIVGVAHQDLAEEGQAFVELVEEEVREHGGDHGALGQSTGERNDPGAVVDLRADPALEKGENVGIERQAAEASQQLVVIDVVEKPFDVRVHHPAEALLPQLVDAVDGVLDRAPLAEGVAAVLEFGLEDLPREQMDGGLGHPVAHGGDGEALELGFVFRHLKAEKRQRVIAPADEPVLEVIHLDLQMVVEVRDGDAVRAPAAAVLPDAVEGRVEGAAGGELVEHDVGLPVRSRLVGDGEVPDSRHGRERIC